MNRGRETRDVIQLATRNRSESTMPSEHPGVGCQSPSPIVVPRSLLGGKNGDHRSTPPSSVPLQK